jgi:hypothetical protein
MRRGFLTALFALLPFGFFAVSLSATPVNWTLSGVTFNDGGTASGSFIYDAGLNQYSSINLATTAGTILAGANYLFPSIGVAPSNSFLLSVTSSAVNLTGTPGLALSFGAFLTDAGGSISTSGGEAGCFDATCSGPAGPGRLVVAGNILATPQGGGGSDTPEPSSALLLGLGGTVIGMVRRRRQVQ